MDTNYIYVKQQFKYKKIDGIIFDDSDDVLIVNTQSETVIIKDKNGDPYKRRVLCGLNDITNLINALTMIRDGNIRWSENV